MRRGSERGSGGVLRGLLQELVQLQQGGAEEAEDVFGRMREVIPLVLENYCRPGRGGERELKSVCQLVDLVLGRFPAAFHHGQGPELSSLWMHLLPLLAEPTLGPATHARLVRTLRLAGELYAQGSPGYYHRALVVGCRELLADLAAVADFLPLAGSSGEAGLPENAGDGGEGGEASELEIAVLSDFFCMSKDAPGQGGVSVCVSSRSQWEALCLAALELLEGLVPTAMGDALRASSVLESLDFFLNSGVKCVLPPASRLVKALLQTSCDCEIVPIDPLLHSVMSQAALLTRSESVLSEVSEDLEAAGTIIRELYPYASFHFPFQLVKSASDTLLLALSRRRWGKNLALTLQETIRAAVERCPSVSQVLVESIVSARFGGGYGYAHSVPEVMSLLHLGLSNCYQHHLYVDLRADLFCKPRDRDGRPRPIPQMLRGQPASVEDQITHIFDMLPHMIDDVSVPMSERRRELMLAFDIGIAGVLGSPCRMPSSNLNLWELARRTLEVTVVLKGSGVAMHRNGDIPSKLDIAKLGAVKLLLALLLLPADPPWQTADKEMYYRILKFPWWKSSDSDTHYSSKEPQDVSASKCCSLLCISIFTLRFNDKGPFKKLLRESIEEEPKNEPFASVLAGLLPFLGSFAGEIYDKIVGSLPPAEETSKRLRESFLVGFREYLSSMSSGGVLRLILAMHKTAQLILRRYGISIAVSDSAIENTDLILGASTSSGSQSQHAMVERPDILARLRDIICSLPPSCESSLGFPDSVFECVKLALLAPPTKESPDPPWVDAFIAFVDKMIQVRSQASVLGRLQSRDGGDFCDHNEISSRGLSALQIVARFGLESPNSKRRDGQARGSFLSQLQRVAFDDSLTVPAQVFVLQSVTLFGAHATDQGSLIVAIIILVGSLDRGWAQRSIAARGLEVILDEHGFQSQDLSSQLPMMFEYLGRNLIKRPRLIDEAADVLFQSNREVLLRHALLETLPRIVDARDTPLLNAFSEALGVTSGQLLLDHGHIALCPALDCSTQSELNNILKYVEKVTGDSWEEIFQAKARLIVELVIWNEAKLGVLNNSTVQCVSVPATKVESARRQVEVVRVALKTNDLKQSGGTTIEADVPNFLYSRHMLGLLASINSKLRETAQMEKSAGAEIRRRSRPLLVRTQVQSLRMVEILIKLAETHVGPFTPDVMALLNHGLQKSDLQVQRQALVCLHALVVSLAKFKKGQLSTMLHQIVVMVLPFAEMGQANGQGATVRSFEGEVQQILSELLVKNRKALGKELQHLPPLPELPFLKGINSSLAKAKTELDQSGELRNLIANLEHDSQAVRYVALDRLRIFLAREKTWVDKLFTSGTSPGRNEKLKVSLLESLLRCCEVGVRTVLTGKMSLRCADCLGRLGAIDPALLPDVLQSPAANSAFNLDDDLPFNIVSTELFRMLTTASDLGALESTRYAIQQLLKIYMKSSVDDLAEDVRVYVRPLLTSRYRLEKNQNKESSVCPIFGSTTMSFREWLLLWTKDLVTQVPPKHPRKALFDSCQGLFKYDMRTMLTVLPYLVGTVLAHGTDSACDNVRMEILSVLGSGSSQVETRDNGEDTYTEPLRRATPAPSFRADTTHSKLSPKQKKDPEERSSMAELSMQAIFDLLDKLGTYVSAVKKREGFESAKARCARKVEGTLNKIPKSLLAHAALKCGAHARALLHYELHLRIQNPHGQNAAALTSIDPLPDDLVTSLLEMYVPLEEPDGLAGLVKLRKTQSLSIDNKLLGEKAGNWTDVLCMYEKDLQGDLAESPHASLSSPGQLSSDQRGYMRCLLNTGHLKALQTHVDGLLAKEGSRKIRGQIAAFGADAAWRLGQWSSLDYYVEQHALSGAHHTETGWPTRLGRLLLSAKACNSESFNDGIGKARTALMAPLAAASMESYGRAYPFLVRLHMLHELETAYTAFLNFRSSLVSETAGAVDTAAAIRVFSEDVGRLNWRERISRTQPTLVVREPLVVFHRTICMLLKGLCEEKVSLSSRDMNRVSRLLRSSVGECWLDQAQMCRRAGHLEPASVAVLQAVDHRTPNALLEKAHLLWQNDKKHQAISELRLVELNTRLLNSNKRGEAKALLRLARWAGLTGHARDDQLVHLYRDVIKRDKEWDKGYFHFAEYLDEVMQDMKQRRKEAEMSGHKGRGLDRSRARHYIEYLPEVIKQYGSSAARGTKKLFQNMPRMLTLWYNFGVEEQSYRQDVTCGTVAIRVGRDVNAVVQEFAKSLPTSAWLAVLPQLISRVCHPNAVVNRITKDIITRVLLRFPQQVLWSLAAVSNSNVVVRKQTALKILASARSQASQEEVRQLFQEFETFVDQMKKLCNHTVEKRQRSFLLSKSGKYNLLKRTLPIHVIVPIQAALTPSFSASAAGLCDSPFGAEHTTTINSVDDKVGVLTSLQRPKKVNLIGDNGRSYTFLFKPKDDLRKDARLMEFASVLNQLFAKAPQSRRRGLYLRTFAVLPLTEDCGMIEWVPNTHMLRGCCQDTYAEVGLWGASSSSDNLRQIGEIHKEFYDEVNRNDRDPTQWLDKVLHILPPKLHMWFIRAFPEPSQWFKARLNFSRTAAVWSMVGHILGLGDRHGENVLLDGISGDVVHVDFACLFDKGLELGQPEVVPFRLTQNMVDACGIQGCEGVFRRTCEISLSVLRSNKGALMSVLDTFVHDPLVEWTDTHGRTGGRAPREQDNPFAVQALENIQSRLSGVVVGVDAAPSLPLSPEGQADRLIAEATSKRNLGDMYIWWMPWF